jgi:hypothetical protein
MLELKVTVSAEPELLGAMNSLAAALNGAKLDYAPIQTGAEVIPPPPVYAPPVNPLTPAAPFAPPSPVGAPVPAIPTAPDVPTAAQAVTPQAPMPSVPTAAAPTYSRDQIMTAGAALIDAGKMNELVTLLNSYGVQAVTQLKQEQLGAFATELRKMGAQI